MFRRTREGVEEDGGKFVKVRWEPEFGFDRSVAELPLLLRVPTEEVVRATLLLLSLFEVTVAVLGRSAGTSTTARLLQR